jgi:hypothetical protein
MTETEYFKRAEQCEREAAAASNSEIKAQLDGIASYWRELALFVAQRTEERR